MDAKVKNVLALAESAGKRITARATSQVQQHAPGTVYQDRRGVTYKVLHSGAHVRLSPRPSGHR